MDNDHKAEDELRPEYEEGFWKGAVRGKYADRYAASARVVQLAPDVAASFRDDESVNEALRLVLTMDDTSRSTKQHPGSATPPEHEDVGQFFRDSGGLEAG